MTSDLEAHGHHAGYRMRAVAAGEGELIWPSTDPLSQLSIVPYLRVSQRGKTNRRYLYMKNIYYKELAYMIMEPEKSQSGVPS